MLVDLIFFSLSEWHLEVIKKTKIQVSQSTSSALFSIFLLLKRGQIDPTPLAPNVFPTFKKGFEAIKMKLSVPGVHLLIHLLLVMLIG